MRRVGGLVLLGLGVLLIALAPFLRTYDKEQLLKTPLDQWAKSISPGHGSYLDFSTQTVRSDVDIVARRVLFPDVKGSTEDVNVWNESLTLMTADGKLINASTDRVALDRKTAMAVHCCNENIDNQPVRHDGLSYKFPFHTDKKKTYPFFDTVAKRAFPMVYASTEKVQGLTTYKFVQHIAPRQIRTSEVPGSLVNQPDVPSVTAPIFYTNVRTVWIEPTTGVIIKGSEVEKVTLRDSSGQDATPVLDATLQFDEATQGRQADIARKGLTKIHWVSTWGPLLALVVGLVVLALGVWLLLGRSGDRRTGGRDNASGELVTSK